MNPLNGERVLFLSPSVASGKERECTTHDFELVGRHDLGRGAFGRVSKVRHKSTGDLYAIKAIPKAKIDSDRLKLQLTREIRVMYSLNHPHIVKLYNHFEDDSSIYLILELAEAGSLFRKLTRVRNFDERSACQYLREVALAVHYLHTRTPPIIHRDIKPENIFLDANGAVKLGDFGWCSTEMEARTTYCGTLEYLAPEMIDRRGHGPMLDIWSLGVLLFELLTGQSPFKAKSQQELFRNIKACKVGFPKNYPLAAKDLTRKLLHSDPSQRLTAAELLSHPWMDQHVPLRKTIEMDAVPGMLIVEASRFDDSEYKVISQAHPADAQLIKEKQLKAYFETQCRKLKQELCDQSRESEKLTHFLQNKNRESLGLDQRLHAWKAQTVHAEDTHSKLQTAKSKLDELGQALELLQSQQQALKKLSANDSLHNHLLEALVRCYKFRLKAFRSTANQEGHVATLEELLASLSRNPRLNSVFSTLERMRTLLKLQCDLFHVVEAQDEEIRQRSNQLAELVNAQSDFETVRQLHADCLEFLFENVNVDYK